MTERSTEKSYPCRYATHALMNGFENGFCRCEVEAKNIIISNKDSEIAELTRKGEEVTNICGYKMLETQEALKRVGEFERELSRIKETCSDTEKEISTLKSTVERMREEVISHYACYTYEKQHYLEEILMKYLEFTEEDVRLYYQRRDEKLSQQEGEK